ncbi:MAG: Tll0287-like domain-containing protein [Nitrospiraceae bacterium]
MVRNACAIGILLLLAALGGLHGLALAKEGDNPSLMIPAETVADYLHAVIEADRTFYTMHVVERLQKKGVIVASENWRIKKTLPLPAQFLMEASELAEKTGAKVRYRLIGLWPINPQNGPANDFERKGLEEIVKTPDQRYSGIVSSGEQQYFQAIYADRAVTQACIGCHNAHPKSPKHTFKANDVMGAIVISIPVGP